jgi:fluoride exporter
LHPVIAISVGAVAGALLRWGLSVLLNPAFASIALGTLAVNVIGGYLAGIAMGVFPGDDLGPAWRLLAVTGFLGSLTTFSAFSAEVVTQLQAQNYGWAAATMTMHLAGSLAATFLGFATWNALSH